MPVGIGYDIHRLVEDRKLILGGVEIPYLKGLYGHSDGDVLIHAICDALLGAMGEADIGKHFPDTEPSFANISSSELLKKIKSLLKKKNYLLENLDTVIIAEEPKIDPFRERIRENIALTLELPIEKVNIKAKTSEGLGFIGSGEAIACYAIVSVKT